MRSSSFAPFLGLLSLLSAQDPAGPDAVAAAARRHAVQPRDETASVATLAPATLTDPSDLTPIHTLDPDPDGDYGIWAAGGKYKVSFHGEMTFIPYLGSEYPHNQPLSWRTTSVRAGTEELLGAGEIPARQQEQFRYSYRYRRFAEVYDVLPAGLEQSFVIRDPVRGNLVIEGQLTTALHAETMTGEHREIRFYDDQQRLITTYGKAWAIDACGNRTEVTSTSAEGRIRLTVDGSWLARAAFPVTVDPIVTPTQISWGTARYSADVCRDDSANDRMLVFIRVPSAGDNDVYARILEDDYSTSAVVFSDISTSWTHSQVRAACADSPQKYVVVFDRLFVAGTGSRAIRFHVHDSGDLTLSTTVYGVAYTNGTFNWLADVGGTVLSSLGDEVLIVYQLDLALYNTNNSQIWGVVVDISGTIPVIGTKFRIGNTSGDRDQDRPAVNKRAAGGSPTVWMVVYQEYNNALTGDDWDDIGYLVDANANISTNYWFPKNRAFTNEHQLGPVVAGTSGRYCVAYAPGDLTLIPGKTGAIQGTEIVAERINWSSMTASPTKFDEHTMWGPHPDRRWRVGDIGFDSNTDSHWALTSLSDQTFTSAATGNIYIDRVGFNGIRLDTATLYAAPNLYHGDHGGVVFDDDNNEWAAVWIQNDTTASQTTGNNAHEIYGTSYYYDPAGAITLSGTSCSSATLSWSPSSFYSPQQLGHEFTSVRVSGAPAGSLNFIGLSLSTANTLMIQPPVAPGCRLLISNTSGWLGWFPLIIGSSGSGDLPIPEWLPALTLHFQDWYIDPATGRAYSTQRLSVPLVK